MANVAWAVPAPARRQRSPVKFCCSSLPPEAARAARGAIHVSQALQTSSTALGTSDLISFCSIKGIPLPLNTWDQETLLLKAKTYLDEERAARIKTGSLWNSISNEERVKLLHRICNGEGDVTYIDPATGYTVFSAFGHLKRGHCCGIGDDGRSHRCRHCPYAKDGRLIERRMVALKERIAVVEFVKRGVQEGLQVEEETDRTEVTPQIQQAPQRVTEIPSLAKVVKLPPVTGEGHRCAECGDRQVVTCTRCNGWTMLFSPEIMPCPQCSKKGYHACMHCTSFRPPARSSFYS